MEKEQFKEGEPIRIGEEQYLIRLESRAGSIFINVSRDTGKSWKSMTSQEIFDLLCDGIKFRKLKEAAQIKKELS